MSNTIDQLKQNSEKITEKLIEIAASYSAFEWRKWNGKKKKTRVREAIVGQDDFKNMFVCDGGKNACGSIFCLKCGKKKVQSINNDYLSYYEREFSSQEFKARQRLRYGTVLHELVPVDPYALYGEDGSIQDLIVSVDKLKRNLKALKRKLKDQYKKSIHLIGTIHIELMDVDLFRIEKVGRETTKQATLRKWFDKVGRNHDYYFMVHTHFMIDNKGMTNEDLMDVFRTIKEWNVTREQVLIKRYSTHFIDTNKKHTLIAAFKNISEYGYNWSNPHLKFATAWGASRKQYQTIEKRDAFHRLKVYAKHMERPDIDEELSIGQIRLLIKAHNTFTNNGMDSLKVEIRSGED
jgi:hypothetical protein